MMPAVHLTYYPGAIQQWMANVEMFALYHQKAIDMLARLGAAAVETMKSGHPPGGPHPPDGEMPVYGDHAYIDRTGWLTDSIGMEFEPPGQWDPTAGPAPPLPTLWLFATAPYADAVESGTPHSRPYPFFWPTVEDLLTKGSVELAAIVAEAQALKLD
jgi:hypothetical protein